jgi:glycosyltransferase involved in cell wall biosynthesis
MRWFFYYFTVCKPVGGLKHIRVVASLLRELGIEAFLLRDGPVPLAADLDDNRLYDIPVPDAPFAFADAGDRLRPDDVLVLPEVTPGAAYDLCRGWKCRLALYNQNGFYALRFCPSRRRMGRRFDFAIANAPYVAGVCETFLGVPRDRVFIVPYWVMRDPFTPGEQPPRLAISCMPRKLGEHVRKVRDEVQRAEPDVPWVEIDDIPSSEVAHRFRECAIFFSTQHMEGFGLPALEAMACGALVAGYAGTGGFPPPYARPENGLWVRDGDMAAAAAAVSRAIAVARRGGEELARYLAAAREAASRYTKEATIKALADMLRGIAEGEVAQSRRFDLGWRGKLAGLRVLYESDRLGWPGLVVSWLSRQTKPFRPVRSVPELNADWAASTAGKAGE